MKEFLENNIDKFLLTGVIVIELFFIAFGNLNEVRLAFWQGSAASLISMLGILLKTKEK